MWLCVSSIRFDCVTKGRMITKCEGGERKKCSWVITRLWWLALNREDNWMKGSLFVLFAFTALPKKSRIRKNRFRNNNIRSSSSSSRNQFSSLPLSLPSFLRPLSFDLCQDLSWEWKIVCHDEDKVKSREVCHSSQVRALCAGIENVTSVIQERRAIFQFRTISFSLIMFYRQTHLCLLFFSPFRISLNPRQDHSRDLLSLSFSLITSFLLYEPFMQMICCSNSHSGLFLSNHFVSSLPLRILFCAPHLSFSTSLFRIVLVSQLSVLSSRLDLTPREREIWKWK